MLGGLPLKETACAWQAENNVRREKKRREKTFMVTQKPGKDSLLTRKRERLERGGGREANQELNQEKRFWEKHLKAKGETEGKIYTQRDSQLS